jgi:thymidylate kinase
MQKIFSWCLNSWLISLETPKPDVTIVLDAQKDLLDKALKEQEAIG